MFTELIVTYINNNLKVFVIGCLIIGILLGGVGVSLALYISGYLNIESGVSHDPGTNVSKDTIHTLSSATNSSASMGDLFVDISGAVVKPGVIKAKIGDRVIDVIGDAGGFDALVSVSWVSRVLNLSMPIKDSQKLYIPFEYDISPNDLPELSEITLPSFKDVAQSTSSSNSTSGDSDSKALNINTATKQQLVDLPGIGDVTADKILTNRPYTNGDDLKSRGGVTSSTYEKIKDQIKFSN